MGQSGFYLAILDTLLNIHDCIPVVLRNSLPFKAIIRQLLESSSMAPHSSTPDWKIPWMEEPGRLQSMGSLRVRHD